MSRSLSRKDFLAASGAGLTALALPRFARGGVAAVAAPPTAAAYFSEPLLKPPTLTVSTLAHPAPGYLFLATLNGPGQRGPMIVDNAGNVVFFRPVDTVAINFRRQTFAGKPVLTWWEGVISKIGTGQGEGVILDETYSTIARVQAGNGFKADVHELLLTANNTALITVFNPVQADLTAVGGPVSGTVLDSIVQEIDVKTGSVLFEWHSLDHVPITDTYAPVLDPFDYFHANSIDVDTDGNLLISARNTSAIYKVDRTSGNVLWRLSGRSSDFELGPSATFMYQHDGRAHPDGTITVFDDGPGPSSQQSRGIRLGLDLGAMRADLLQEYRHPDPLAAVAMGNVQVLGGDAVCIGW
ncbi:MAG TPA: arylsulfotransferase family protein, partial [Mycobacteriales bacterium]|nr:arylsulfotransferase family protein [Mycobacteriales bacterium]